MHWSPILIALALVGCAQTPPRHSVPPLASFSVDQSALSTGMPNFPLDRPLLEAAVAAPARAPAAVSDDALVKLLEQDERKPSLRRLYFRALYQEWRQLQTLAEARPLKACPQFHHDRVVTDEQSAPLTLSLSAARPAPEELSYYPEWALALERRLDLRTALREHTETLRLELQELCEAGSSDGYFRLENLVTYHDRLEGLARTRALLKIPVFSSMFLVRTLSHESFSVAERELLESSRGLQLEKYIVELRKRRQSLLSSR